MIKEMKKMYEGFVKRFDIKNHIMINYHLMINSQTKLIIENTSLEVKKLIYSEVGKKLSSIQEEFSSDKKNYGVSKRSQFIELLIAKA